MRFLCFGDDWGRHPSTMQHVFWHIAADKNHEVIWFNSVGQRSFSPNKKDALRIIDKMGNLLRLNSHSTNRHAYQRPANLRVVEPFIIPLHRTPSIRWINRRLLSTLVKRILREKGWTRFILVTSNPVMGDILPLDGASLSLYYCLDEYSEMPDVSSSMLQYFEKELLKKIDLVAATSRTLVEHKSNNRQPTIYLPHGVDFNHFSRPSYETITQMEDCPKPIVGFVGILGEWIDINLLLAVVKAYSDTCFVFIGPIKTDTKGLESHHNVTMTGPVPYEMLPHYMRYFRAALIPYRKTKHIYFVNPLKLMEYLSMGFPVISTSFPEITHLKEIVYISDGPDDFIKQLGNALSEPQVSQVREHRIAVAASNSWQTRAKKLVELCKMAV